MNINFLFSKLNQFSIDLITQINVLKSSAIKNEYLSVLLFIIFAIFLAFLIVILSYFLVVQNPETEKLSTYECGFEPYEDSRNSFNVKFYIVAILFILFDIEIIFMLPWCITLSQLNILGFWTIIEFILELGVGFFYVWCAGSLEWK